MRRHRSRSIIILQDSFSFLTLEVYKMTARVNFYLMIMNLCKCDKSDRLICRLGYLFIIIDLDLEISNLCKREKIYGETKLWALVRLIPLASLLVGSHGHIRIPEYILYYKILYYFLLYILYSNIFYLDRLLSKMVARGIKRTSAKLLTPITSPRKPGG